MSIDAYQSALAATRTRWVGDVLMASIRELAEAALASDQPALNLEALVRSLITEGETRETIAAELGALVEALRNGSTGETPEEELVLEILDRLRGWCSPDARL